MVKEYFLSKSITGEIFLDRDYFDRNRESVGFEKTEGLLFYLNEHIKKIDKKRKDTFLYVEDNFSKEGFEKICNLFKGTKIKVSLEKDLREL
jgi:hypothetical protein